MFKRISVLFVLVCVLFTMLPAGAFAADQPAGNEPADLVRNSDMEVARDGVCWYVDTMADGCLTVSRLTGPTVGCVQSCEVAFETERLTEYPVDQLLLWEDCLLVSVNDRLLTLSPENGEVLQTRCFDAPVDRFARSSDALYVLTDGRVLRLDGEETTVVGGGVTHFWLEGPDSLCYMRDEQTVHTLRLSCGTVTDAPNLASDLGDVPLFGGKYEVNRAGLTTLKQKFPHGKYWNHMPKRGTGMSCNNQNGWTSQPCSKHNNYCGTSQQTCNGYAPNGVEISYQCWGFADKLGLDATGCDPQNSPASGWKKLWYASSLNNLKAGDIIRFNKYGNSKYAHSIYVTAVSGDTITYADCNYDGTCVIRWNQTISKSTVRSWFVFLLSAPITLQKESYYLLDVDCSLDGAPAETASGWATFDVLVNGKAYKTGVTEFREYCLKGIKFEIRNVGPVSGVMFDESGSEALTGTLSGNCTLKLTLDHYYLNSAGTKVKTTLTDLPAQGKWSYRPVCWALENGIASGVSQTSFAPNQKCTRAQAVTFLWVLSGRPQPTLQNSPFADVKEKSYYYTPVLWAVERGITAGKEPERFKPNDICTRAEVVAFLWNLSGRPTPKQLETSAAADSDDRPALEPDPDEGSEPEPAPEQQPSVAFTDLKPTAFYYRAVLWALENGITSGTSATQFSPKRVCTRAEILTFLYAFQRTQ